MENKHKRLLKIAAAEILLSLCIVIFFSLPFTKAVSWKNDNGRFSAKNTRFSTNYSAYINEEIKKLEEIPFCEDFKKETQKELEEHKISKKTGIQTNSMNVISNTSNSSVLEFKREYRVLDNTKPRSDGSQTETVLSKDCWHLNIYIDKNGIKMSTEKIY